MTHRRGQSLKQWLDKKTDRENMALCFDPWQTLDDDVDDNFDLCDAADAPFMEVWRYFERFERIGDGCYLTKPAPASE